MPLKPFDGTLDDNNTSNGMKEFTGKLDSEKGSVGGEFVKGIRSGALNVKSTAQGAAAAVAELTGREDTRKQAIDAMQATNKQAEQYAPEVGSLKDVGSVSDAAKLAAHGIGGLIPFAAESAVAGGLGAKVTGGIRGALAGSGAASVATETGSIYGDQLEKTGKTDALTALGYAVPAAALDVVPEAGLFKKVLHDSPKESFAKAVGKQMLSEGATEAAQTAIERAGVKAIDPNNPDLAVFNPEGINEIATAGVIGALGGGAMGGITEGVSRLTSPQEQQPLPPSPLDVPPTAPQSGPQAPAAPVVSPDAPVVSPGTSEVSQAAPDVSQVAPEVPAAAPVPQSVIKPEDGPLSSVVHQGLNDGTIADATLTTPEKTAQPLAVDPTTGEILDPRYRGTPTDDHVANLIRTQFDNGNFVPASKIAAAAGIDVAKAGEIRSRVMEERNQAAAAAAPQAMQAQDPAMVQDIVSPKTGEPFKTIMQANQYRNVMEQRDYLEAVKLPDGGWVVRPKGFKELPPTYTAPEAKAQTLGLPAPAPITEQGMLALDAPQPDTAAVERQARREAKAQVAATPDVINLPGQVAKPQDAALTNEGNTTQASEPAKKLPYASKESLDHLFGTDKKREAALKRIENGKAWFGTKLKAKEFIAKNGLKDDHDVVQTGPSRFEVKAKGVENADATAAGNDNQASATVSPQEQSGGQTAGKPVDVTAQDGSGRGDDTQGTARSGGENLSAANQAADTKPALIHKDAKGNELSVGDNVSGYGKHATIGKFLPNAEGAWVAYDTDGKVIGRPRSLYKEDIAKKEEESKPALDHEVEVDKELARAKIKVQRESLKQKKAANGSLEEKLAANKALADAQEDLRKKRLNIFDAQDAAKEAIQKGDASLFDKHSATFPELADKIKQAVPAKQEESFSNDKSDLVDRAGKVYERILAEGKPLEGINKKEWKRQNEEQADNPERFHKVEEAQNDKGLKIGDAVTVKSGNSSYDGLVTSITTHGSVHVQGFDSFGGWARVSDVEKLPDGYKFKAANTAESSHNKEDNREVGNEQSATEDVGTSSAGSLEGKPATDVRPTEATGDAGKRGDEGRRGNPERDVNASGTRSGLGTGLGDVPGDVSVPTGGARSKRGTGGKRGVRSAEGSEPALSPGQSGVTPQAEQATQPSIDFNPVDDYRITEDTELGEGGQKTKYKRNVEAIRLLNTLQEQGRKATPEEQNILARYVGWGGIPQAFDPNNEQWSKEYKELRSLLSEEEYAEAARSTQYAHYTSKEIIEGIYDAVKHLGFSGGKAIEPGTGVGNFLGMMPEDLRGSTRFTGVERERIAGGIAKNLYPNQNIQLADFTEWKGQDDYFDLAIGNPPFSSTTLTDLSGRKHLSGLSIHNYFFGKSVDMLRENGILAMVVSNSFMDAKRDKARKYISERTRFLGAVRLPNNAFSKNANTEVTTDIVFLQKRPESEWGGRAATEDAKAWLDIGEVRDRATGKSIPLNQYFIDHPEMMLGEMTLKGTMYRPDTPALVSREGQDTGALLKEAVKRLPPDVFVPAAVSKTAAMETAMAEKMDGLTVQEGGYFIRDEQLYQRAQDEAGEQMAVKVTPNTQWSEKTVLGINKYRRLVDLAKIRQTLRDLIKAEQLGNKSMDGLRDVLNRQYDAYVKANGFINERSTVQLFGDDPDFPLLAALEHSFDPGISKAVADKQGVSPIKPSASKAPIFSRRVIEQRKAVTSADTPEDALAVSLAERGTIDPAYIGQLLGKDSKEALDQLVEKEMLFVDPATGGYVLADEYLSGNVRKKLSEALTAGSYKNAKALEKVIPEDIQSHLIDGQLGAHWVPASIYEDFAKELLGDGTTAFMRYLSIDGSWMSVIGAGSDVANTNTYGIPEYPATKIIDAIMNDRTIRVGHYDQQGKFILDKEKTDLAEDKKRELEDKFGDWLFADPDRSEKLVRAYNDVMNNYVTRKFDGSLLSFPGKVPDAVIKFRRHQRNAIWRIVQDRTTLLDHVVGAGKTFTVIAGAMELRRMGLAKKPMIAVPNHLVKQWAADFYRLYPGANILVATKKDFAKENRRKFLAKIATGDWDAVVIAHSSFGFIKPDQEFEERFVAQEIDKVTQAITEAQSDEGKRNPTVKRLEAIKERLENRIKRLRDKRMDNLLDFAEIGVDQLFVDEAHLFKNLMFTTKMGSNVRGLGSPEGSQRAYDMYIKTQQVMEKNGRGQGVVFATGTPVSNSLAEKYHMLRYLKPDVLKQMGHDTFDAWAKTFAKKETVWMQSLSGQGYKASVRLGTFANVPELLKIYDMVADTVTMDDIKKAYSEENNGKEFPLPKLKGGRRTPVSIPISDAQASYMEEIAKRAQELERRKGRPQKGEDNMLSIMSDARKCAMDIRLVDFSITEREKGGRIDLAASDIWERYQKYNDVKGTQLVFSDMGTPKKHAAKELKEYEELRAAAAPLEDADLQARATFGDEEAKAALDKAEEAANALEAKGNDWLDAVKAAERGFSVYDDLKAALVEKGIPEDEVAFIHDYNTDDQKAALFRAVNSGKIRVLLGSTEKMGAGTNVQERVVAEYHLDVPWKPSDVEQREGRVIRQGNKLIDEIPDFEVEIRAYATQDTLDLFMWQTQEKKLAMIGKLRERNIGRDMDNAFEEMQMSAGEMQAAATSNPYLMEEIQTKDKIKKLERQKRSFDAQKNDIISRRRRAQRDIDTLPGKIKNLEKLDDARKAYAEDLKNRFADFSVEINGKTYTDYKEAQDTLKQLTDGEEPKEGERRKKISVEFNGKEYGSRAALGDAFAAVAGDFEPILFKRGRKVMNQRKVIRADLKKDLMDALETGTEKKLGSFGDLDLLAEIEKRGEKDVSVNVTVEKGGAYLNTSFIVGNENPEQLVEYAAAAVLKNGEELVDRIRGNLSWAVDDLAKAKRTMKDLDSKDSSAVWPGEAELTEAREKYTSILKKLEEFGKDTADKPKYSLAGNYAEEIEVDPAFLAGLTEEQLAKPFFTKLAQNLWKEQGIESPFFQRWFGKSKITANGKPRAVYHATDADFTVFDKDKLKGNTGHTSSLLGFFFAPTPHNEQYGHRTMKVYLRMENPYMMSIEELQRLNEAEDWQVRARKEELRQQGYDGVFVKDAKYMVVFDNTQIKSVNNQGTFSLKNPDIRYRKDIGAGVKAADVQGMVSGMNWKNGPSVTVVQSIGELPFKANAQAAGAFYKGKVYLVADNLKDMNHAQFVLFHEALGHYGLLGTLGNGLRPVMGNIYRSNASVRALADTWMKENNSTDLPLATEEALSDLAGTGKLKDVKGWDKLVNAIRNFLRRIGFNLEFTDNDVAALMADARKFVKDGAHVMADDQVKYSLGDYYDKLTGRDPKAMGDIRQSLADMLTTNKTFNNWWHKTVGTQYHKAEVDADFAKVFNKGQDYLNDVSKFAMDAADAAPDILPKLEKFKDILKGGASKKDLEVVSNAVFEGTLTDKKVYTDAELSKRFGMSAGQIELYRQFRQAVNRSLDDVAASEVVRLIRNEDLGDTADLIKKNPGIAHTIAISRLTAQAKGLEGGEKKAKMELAHQINQKAEQVKQLKAEGYAPLMRFGQYTVYVTRPGENGATEQVYFGMFEREAEATKMARAMREEYPDADVKQGIMSQDSYKLFQGLSPDTLELFGEAVGVDENALFQEYLKLAVNNRSALKRLIKRKGVSGFDTDVSRVLATFITSNARGASGNYHFGEMTKAVQDIPQAKGDVKDEAIKLMTYLQNPQEEASAVRGYLFFHFLGGSVASMLTNMTQPFMMTLPFLSQYGGRSAAKAMQKYMGNAMGKEFTGHMKEVMDRAVEEGIVAPHEIHQLYAESIQGLGRNMVVRRGLKVWGSLFALAEAFNRRLTFAAAYDMAQSFTPEQFAKAGVKDAYEFATKAVYDTQGLYNRGNRPNWARGTLGATVFTFKQYSVAYLEFLKRLPPRERALALAILVAAAGVNGLPFADDIEDLIDTLMQFLGYNWNTKKKMREGAAQILGETGGGLVNNGLSAMPGMPLDVQRRLGLGNLLPGTAMFKVSETDKTSDIMEFLGPVGGLAQTAGKATEAASTGDIAGAARQVLPVAIQNALKGVEMMWTGKFMDSKGRMVSDADQSEGAIKAIGFQPKRMARESQLVSEENQRVKMARAIESGITDEWARGIATGDKEAVQSAKSRLKKWNEDNPDSLISLTPGQILRRVKDLKMTRQERFLKTVPKEMRKGVMEDLAQ